MDTLRTGFTMVELLIVIIVVALLTVVVMPLGFNAYRGAKASQVAQNFRSIRNAVENWWLSEHPTPRSVSLRELRERGYLNFEPSGFAPAVELVDERGSEYVFEIRYEGGDISAELVSELYGLVSNNVLKFSLRKAW